MKVLVTGANGLIGAHVVRVLLQRDYTVRVFVRATSDLRSLEGLPVETMVGDVMQYDTVREACAGCDLVFHLAVKFTYWGIPPKELRTVATQGTANVLKAAAEAGVKRVVLTSSSVTLGATSQPVVRDEFSGPQLNDAPAYVHAKIEQERFSIQEASRLGLELIAVCPTITVGGPDYGLTASNRMITSYIKDPWKASWIGGCNIVSVRDVAEGHVLAAERGSPGERYILGAENLTWQGVHKTISELTGLPGPLVTGLHSTAYLAATVYEMISHFTGEAPVSTRDQAKMVGNYYWYDHHRIQQLGYAPRPARRALAEAVSWLVASEHVPADIRASMNLAPEIYAVRQHQSSDTYYGI